ncbi:anthrone oxygenase family protein [Microbispora bryophytorum]|uniref:anthrone oxygenase family protein n=1 Tax=Microbispora bryophytorum TaxID=1460882 RepID=UPI0033E22E48
MTYLLAAAAAALSMLMTAGMAGTFFGFSVGVMPGLNAAPAPLAIDAMNAVNVKIQNPVFLAAFVLAPVAAAGAGALLLATPRSGAAWPFFAAAAVYAVGVILITAAVNVPMNDALAAAGGPTATRPGPPPGSGRTTRPGGPPGTPGGPRPAR